MFKFDETFIRNYNKYSNIGYIFKINFKYPKQLDKPHNDLRSFPEGMKNEKCKKLLCNLYKKKKICCTYKIFEAGIKS